MAAGEDGSCEDSCTRWGWSSMLCSRWKLTLAELGCAGGAVVTKQSELGCVEGLVRRMVR